MDAPGAVKVIYRREFRDSDQVQLFEKEIRVLSLLRHPNIVQFLGVCTDTENCIISELMGGGSIDELVLSQFHILEANAYLRPRIILNIARAKVADFGLSRVGLDEKMTSAVGYLPYQAPEVFTGSDYTEKADVYSFGMVVWFLFSGVHPDKDAGTPLKMAHMVAYKQYRPPMPERIPPYWGTLIEQCWNQTPAARPTFAQIIGFILEFKQRFGGDEKGYLMDTLPRSPNTATREAVSFEYLYEDEDDEEGDTSGNGSGSGSGSGSGGTGVRLTRDVGYADFHSGGERTSGEYVEVSPTPPSAAWVDGATPLAPPPPSPSGSSLTSLPPDLAETATLPHPLPIPAKAKGSLKRTSRLRCKKVKCLDDKPRKPRKGMTERRIIIGNSCEPSGMKGVPYAWTMYAKGSNNEDLSPFLKHVKFILHPTFFPREVTVRAPPYQVLRRGWGVFEVGVVLTFKDDQFLNFRHQLDFDPNRPAERAYDVSFPTAILTN